MVVAGDDVAQPDVLVMEPCEVAWAKASGFTAARLREPTPAALARARRVLMAADWAQLRAWRMAGHRFGVVVVSTGPDLPTFRAELEPMVVVRSTEPAILADAWAQLDAGEAAGRIGLRNGTVDPVHRVWTGPGGCTGLTQREVDLLGYLAARPHRDVPREELLVQVWGHAKASLNTRAVDMAIARLRKKIEVDPAEPATLLTSRGGGYRLVLAGADDPAAPPRRPLPSYHTRFLGRQGLVADLVARVPTTRLLTLLGPPGAGKTRTLVELGHSLVRAGDRDVAFVNLLPAQDVVGVVQALALGLGVGLAGEEEALARMGEWLEGAQDVVLLDNAEHVADAVASVLTALVDRAPGVRWVVTSQVRLDLPWETVQALAALDHEDARLLLMDRADFTPSQPGDSARLDEVVERLDLLPLSMELAAARVRSMGLDGVLQCLDAPLDLLTRRGADTDPRHATLRGAIAHAWALLPLHLAEAMGTLSVFRGGFELVEAAAVLGLSGVAAADVLDGLWDRSLLSRQGRRYDMVGAIRDFSVEVSPLALLARARDAHGEVYAGLAVTLRAQSHSAAGSQALARLLDEQANLMAAWQHHVPGRPVLVRALDVVWRVIGTPERRRDRLTGTLQAELLPTTRATLLFLRGWAKGHLRDTEGAIADLEEALALAEPDTVQQGRVCVDLAYHHLHRGRFGRAADIVAPVVHHPHPVARAMGTALAGFIDEMRRVPDDAGDRLDRMEATLDVLLAHGRYDLAFSAGLLTDVSLTNGSQPERAAALCDRLMQVQEALGDPAREGLVWVRMGRSAASMGHYHEALDQVERGLLLLSRHGRPEAINDARSQRMVIAAHVGAFEVAHATASILERGYRAAGNVRMQAFNLVARMCLLLDEGKLDQIPPLLGHLDAMLEQGEALDMARDNRFLVAALLALAEGDPVACRAALTGIDQDKVVDSNRVQMLVATAVAGLYDDDVSICAEVCDTLDAHLAVFRGHARAEWQALSAALRARDVQALEALTSFSRPHHAVVRMLARYGVLALSGAGRTTRGRMS